ncbi:hypothetical protein [Alteromonas lipolytica]|uniref:Aminomethyltransferase folate-binding domain-containing protein n=1 Tax=Alteromonas lipolytica TaxID=1856405 RepID=A0A1E8FBX5_9ALTE|nr:hypothetical protein [Alteromonas lipolytica]OFI33286.1 hypothetical protein BFC17_03225 [Alteromonas lipolytica]GGF61004.1 hypothetical protein GCM10011338_11580 [Alteromonas lipolytica]
MSLNTTNLFAQRQSLLNGWHDAHQAQYVPGVRGLVVSHYAGQQPEQPLAVSLCDLSVFADYASVISDEAAATIKALGLPVPQQVNTGESVSELCAVFKLTDNEYWQLDLTGNSEKSAFTDTPLYQFPLNEHYACLGLYGAQAQQVLAKICAVDISAAACKNLEVIRTSIEQVITTIIRFDLNNETGFLLLPEVSSVEFIWQILLDAMYEFNGATVGASHLFKNIKLGHTTQINNSSTKTIKNS